MNSTITLHHATRIDYTNYRGERGFRVIIPIRLWYGTSSFHIEDGDQWFIRAFDVEKQAERDFAWKDVHSAKSAFLNEEGVPVVSPEDIQKALDVLTVESARALQG